ncbi:NUDIX domain-containing protein [Candidatus Beckwithbacteria bacterium]|nr:NUDIX domain-containing protein [Candidatus Beckwithbacteria bacterium]
MKTKQEFSSGGVVFKKLKNDDLVFLLGKHSGYHKWVLPKGLIEKGETPQQTTTRETEEEMGVKIKILNPEPIHIEKYSYFAQMKEATETEIKNPKIDQATRRVIKYQEEGGKGIRVDKTVTFYLCKYISGDPKDHGWEMEDAGWFSFEKALTLMSFEGEKKALQKALEILNK